MCGLAGVIVTVNTQTPATELARSMASQIAYRGPDDDGVWTDGTGRVALAHRRLSIHDLSPGGHQPMASPDGRYVGVFNGSIHNFRDVRVTLEQSGVRFRSTSDTEVLLAAVQHWGLVRGLQHLSGMFAFGIWDNRDRKLYLARDRAGQKPLYYGMVGQKFAFGSELKAFLNLPGFERRIDPRAVRLYVELTHIPSPYSIYQGLNKLPPGHFAEVSARDTGEIDIKVQAYWRRGAFKPNAVLDYGTARRQAEALLIQSVNERLAADVPLGAFLSGGFDSTAVVALMQAHANSRVRTFTIASADPAYNEGEHARAVAKHLGTEHTEFKVEAKDAVGVVGDLPAIYDEPFADASQVPTVLISRLARQHVTVALTGDGGDEVFGGYNRHLYGPILWRLAKFMPHGVARLVERMPRVGRVTDQIQKVARALPAASATDFYRALVRCWDVAPLVRPDALPSLWYQSPEHGFGESDVAALMMHLDFVDYLGDGVLTKVDRATMSVALEARTPFLDDRLVEFMARLPTAYKVSGGVSKRLLRDLVYARVPRKLVDRPKSGFEVPVDAWLRGPLKDWAADLLDAKTLREGGLFDAETVGRAWDEHQRGTNRDQQLWCVLMFQAWLRHYRAHV